MSEKLADMKQTKAERKDSMPTCGSDDGPRYPYGLQVRLDNASLRSEYRKLSGVKS